MLLAVLASVTGIVLLRYSIEDDNNDVMMVKAINNSMLTSTSPESIKTFNAFYMPIVHKYAGKHC